MVGRAPACATSCSSSARSRPRTQRHGDPRRERHGKELAARHTPIARARASRSSPSTAPCSPRPCSRRALRPREGLFHRGRRAKKGKLEVADGGIRLPRRDRRDEPAAASQTAARAPGAAEFERVGGTRPIKVAPPPYRRHQPRPGRGDQDGGFRADLYYRLNVVSLTMPPLRDRRGHPAAGELFPRPSTGRRATGWCAYRLRRACLREYDWPGNVRELENAIERAVVLGSSDLIRLEDSPEAVVETEPHAAAPRRATTRQSRKRKTGHPQAVEQAGGNYTEAARLLDVHGNHLHRLDPKPQSQAIAQEMTRGRGEGTWPSFPAPPRG